MNEEIKDLLALLKGKDAFKKKWGYDPFDNYAWREVLTFGYLQKWYPTIEKLSGRYNADGKCAEPLLVHIENKSTKLKKRKRTNDYNIASTRFQFDMSKKLDKMMASDAFIFSIFDSDTSEYPIHVLFIHKPENVQTIKDMVIQKQKHFDSLHEEKKGHVHIDLIYSEIAHLGEKYGDQMPTTNIMEFML